MNHMTQIPAARQSSAFEDLRSWLSARCGIHYPENKSDLLRQRLARVQMAHQLRDLDDMAQRVVQLGQHDLQLAVMHAASTNHTYFFREREVLDTVRTTILPILAKRSEIRIWSAACSSGEEAFTLAIMISELLGPEALKRTTILGTDISAPVIERAEAGMFSDRQLEQLPADIRRKYFAPRGLGQSQIRQDIRDTCTFRWMNLKSQPYPFTKPFQIVFCRNILYYFDRPDQIATVRAIRGVTEPGGWLVTSVTENVRDLLDGWTPVASGISQKGGAA